MNRYKILPQMKIYDAMVSTCAPHVSFLSKANYHSSVVNTDAYGFRLSCDAGGYFDVIEWQKKPNRVVVCGGSFVFGVGATSDATTISSRLSLEMDCSCLNLGIRAGSSTQEFISLLPFVDVANRVIVCDGINDLVCNIQSKEPNRFFGAIFFEDAYDALSNFNMCEVADLINSNISNVSIRDMAKLIFKRFHQRFSIYINKITREKNFKQDVIPHERIHFALSILKRNVSHISCIVGKNRFFYAIQPFAEFCKTNLTTEEKLLFAITDEMQGDHWQILKTVLLKIWSSYVNEIKMFCRENSIKCLDVNEKSFNGWSFVDRVHMTDSGYNQFARYIKEEMAQ